MYYYDGWKIVEIRDGSDDMDRQFIHGTQYIDEHVMMRAAGKGDLYIHQGERSERERAAIGKAGRDARDRPATCPEVASTKRAAGGANWNVIATTDLGGNLMEHYVYEPYGSLTVNQSSSWGDGDGDVDATDKDTPGATCTGTPSGQCRILDLDFDGDYDSADATAFDNLVQGVTKKSGKAHSGVEQAMGHQGLVLDSCTADHQNRYRQYGSQVHRFRQRDPLAANRSAFEAFSDGLNVYGYIRSNVGRHTDPLGLGICGSESSIDWICCNGLNWVSGGQRDIYAYSMCCGSAWAGGSRCQAHACLNPNIVQLMPDYHMRQCVVAHECDHMEHFDCDFLGCKCAELSDRSREQEECSAYRAGLQCVSTIPRTPETNNRCNMDGCMVQRLCVLGQTYCRAIEACWAEKDAGFPGRGGCDQPDHPSPPPPPPPTGECPDDEGILY